MEKVVGQPCPKCKTPFIEGRNGTAYCKPCYIEWKNGTTKGDMQSSSSQGDTDGWGKCKYGFLIEAFIISKGGDLTDKMELKAEQYADACMRRKFEKDAVPDVEVNDEISVKDIPF